MATRFQDWLRQARRDFSLAQQAAQSAYYEWACFAAQQAAEKVVKALFQKLGGEAWGHAVAELLLALPSPESAPPDLIGRARELDKHYMPTRYPNLHPAGAPADVYTKEEAERALEHAEAILTFCEDKILS